ncbi:hypothetical protein PV05_10683 [Exophiala xenobiotica]|uniref:Zn(2)-C6 fungal-type domain-containing protein n=1 Tax=Exophiala xenobiotica TaxID=348802 RepID=A0A0D2EM65_9EURO|nr:uncharacterized protein PV05_10683 [Exophiala xenobiotica]KIW48959.1 hypothetical protein PV05_10683 [Exophiala xenobiotica]
MPFPSAGCQTCKFRRIKCDETRPTCQRCLKSRRLCHGMTALAAVHDENSYASGLRKRPRGPRSSLKEPAAVGLDLSMSDNLVELKTQAILYYMHHYLKAPKSTPKVLKAISEDYLTAWVSKIDSPIIELAVSCMALAIFARTQKYPPAALQASLTYHRLLQLARISMPSLVVHNTDICLLTIFFMSRYEDAVYEPTQADPQGNNARSFRHHDGALSILRMWKDRLSFDQPATEIMKYTRRGMIKSALLRKLALPEWISDGSIFGERGLELEYDRIIVRLVNLRHQIFALLRDENASSSSAAAQLAREAQNIDKALEHWVLHFPSTWLYQRYTIAELDEFPSCDFFSPTVYSYSSLAHAAVWNQYYSTRMLSLSTRIRILGARHLRFEEAAERERADCLSCVEDVAEDFARSLPYSLERFAKVEQSGSSSPIIIPTSQETIRPYFASLTIWPLSLASSLENVSGKRASWFRALLARLGKMSGYGVLAASDTSHWKRL